MSQPQVSYALFVNGVKDCVHIVDFYVTRRDGKTEIHETKGYEGATWLRKLMLFTENYDTPYYVIKQDWGRWKYYTAAEILDRAGLKPIKSVTSSQRQYSQIEYLFSAAFHHFFKFIFK